MRPAETSGQSEPLFSVIVPVWNGAATLARCLDAIERQTLPRDRFEVIVVDNGSDDASAAIAAARYGIRVLTEPVPGSYAARNTALAAARGRFIAFTDADCVPDPAWLAAAARALQTGSEPGVLAGAIELFDDEDEEAPVFGDYERLFSFPQAHAARGNCATANWVSPRDLLIALGGFDAAVKSGGDRELALRIRASRRPLVHVPDMIVRHPVRATRDALVRKRRRLSGGRWQRTPRAARLPRVLAVTAFDLTRRLRRGATAKGLSLARRLAVMRLTVELAGVAAGEFFRLAAGRAAARD